MRSPIQLELGESDIAALLGEPVTGAAELAGRAIPVGGERHEYVTGLRNAELERL